MHVGDEESRFYSTCLEEMVFFSDQYDFGDIIEFGSGDGLPVLNALAGRPYINGSIAGCVILV